jgi:hypothetical protein
MGPVLSLQGNSASYVLVLLTLFLCRFETDFEIVLLV